MPSKIKVTSNSTLNSNDKTLTPTSGFYWRVASIRVEYTATATAGNRTLEVRYLDSGGDVIWATEITTDFVASDVMVVNLSPGAATVTPVDAGDEGAQHCAAVLPPEGSVQVVDTGDVDANDDMVVHLMTYAD